MDGVKVAIPAYEEGYFCGELIRELLGMRWSRGTVYKVNGDAEKRLTGLWRSVFPDQPVATVPVSSLLCQYAWPLALSWLSVVVMMDA